MAYRQGQGYRDGYSDRSSGRPNKYPHGMTSATSDMRVYWDEYLVGYAEAHERIMEDARRSVKEAEGGDSRYLAE